MKLSRINAAALLFALAHSAQVFAQAVPDQAVQAQGGGGRMRDVIMALSPAGRALFIQQWLGPERMANANHTAAVRAAQDRVFAVMSAEPFDAGSLRRAYADERALASDFQRARQERLTNVLARLSPADRRIVVSRLLAMRATQR